MTSPTSNVAPTDTVVPFRKKLNGDPIDTAFGIGWAVKHLWAGHLVARRGWNGRGMYLYLHVPAETDHLPYVVMKTADGKHVPWLCSQTDLLSSDWELHRSIN